MKKSTLIAIAAGSTAAVLIGMNGVSNVMAVDKVTQDTLISTLAEKLGLTEDKVSKALAEARAEIHEQKQAEMDALIEQAVMDGKLTNRQAEVIDTMRQIKEEKVNSGKRPEWGAMREDMVNELQKKGLEVTQDELDEIHTTMKELGIGGPMGRRGMRMHEGL